MFQLYHFAKLDSTNDYLKQHYADYKNCSVILADRQTNGRGRFERVWESDHDLTFSILFKENIVSPLVFPLALAKLLEAKGILCGIKWPNDLIVAGRKVCGILIEIIYQGNQQIACIAGIGINTSPKSRELRSKADYLDMDKTTLLTEYLLMLTKLLQQSQEQLLEEYRRFHLLKGRKIRLDDVLWEVQDVQADGTLTICANQRVRSLHSEEITLESVYKE